MRLVSPSSLSPRTAASPGAGAPEADPLWYKDAIIYEVHVRAFFDSNGDGIGDFRGLTAKLDYLQDLGVTALWLLPFYPSPLRDDGYDIADYTGVHPDYGTMRDFRIFLREAHRRGLRVITELVLNHTSDRHPWFQRARRARPGSRWREFYVWSDTPDRYRDARVIFKDFETSNWTFDPVAGAYYWHRFYSHQPDLNYDAPAVRRAMLEVVNFWLGMGVDGLRLDAVPYLYEREGTSCENLPETHAFLKDLRRVIDRRFGGRMLLAEANQWPEEAIAYFGDGDECHMAFHFPLMPRLFMAIRMEDRFPIIEILQQTPPIPESCQWALFLRNHDELTLEMVTDEDRDYMYRVYAQDHHARINLGIRRRLAPLLGNHRRRIELMNGLLFSCPGTPVIYYGDEIGMGDNIYLGDRNSVRTPMQWSADRNAGFSRANPQQLYLPVIIDPEYHYEAVNVEAQQNNPHSLLWWMKRLIALRKRYKAFGRGTLQFLYPDNRKVLAFLRRYGSELILVVANLSRFVQYVELNLAEFKGLVPVELFGRTEFPPIEDHPYFLTLGPHAFYWFALEPQRVVSGTVLGRPERAETPVLSATREWDEVLRGRARKILEEGLGVYLKDRRWFGGKSRRVRSVEIRDAVRVPWNGGRGYLLLVRVEYGEGDPDLYALPLAFAEGGEAQRLEAAAPHAVVAHLRVGEREGLLYDALQNPAFCEALLEAIARRRRLKGDQGEAVATPAPALRRLLEESRGEGALEALALRGDQSNSSVVYDHALVLKVFRRVDIGVNPELEIGRFLTDRANFRHAPAVVGAMEYRVERGEPVTLMVLHQFVPHHGDAWRYTVDALAHYYERVMTRPVPGDGGGIAPALLECAEGDLPAGAYEMVGEYLEAARLLGRRTAELHQALASDPNDPAFAPEEFTPLYQRSLYQSMRNLARRTFQSLRRSVKSLSPDDRLLAERVLDHEAEILRRFRTLTDRRVSAVRIRCHGDYHLGQVLYTGKDFVIIDFEGEPARALSERRMKRPALRDVAGMLRSFDYAASVAYADQLARGAVPQHPEARAGLASGRDAWIRWVAAAYLQGYLGVARHAPFVPKEREDLSTLLEVHLLEKAIYEIDYELNNRPEWVWIPLQGVLRLLHHERPYPSRVP